MTAVRVCGNECGLSVGSLTSKPHMHGSGSPVPTFETTIVHTGLRARRYTRSGSNGHSYDNLDSSSNGPLTSNIASRTWVGRRYFYFVTLPTATALLVNAFTIAGVSCGLIWNASDGKIYTHINSNMGATGSEVIATGRWYLVEWRINKFANPWLIDGRVNGVDLGQKSEARGAEDLNFMTVGLGHNITAIQGDYITDDDIDSHTGTDYPYGPGFVISRIASLDGSHNVAGTNDFERTLTGTDIDNATTTAWQLIAKRPLTTTIGEFINLIAPPNATDYVECIFEPVEMSEPRISPRSVEAICTIHAQSTTGNNLRIALLDANGATQADIHNATVGSASILAKRLHFATIPGGGAWTALAWANMRVRCYSSDPAPDAYFDGIMLEAEFPYLPPLSAQDRPYGLHGARQMQQLLVR